ncbi:MAG TPA: DUF4625 domain-containing protein [Prolixibacteraceae bacterium]|nr:DUF4625 domain-containing protein [Prolixibacteraceae bacterium]
MKNSLKWFIPFILLLICVSCKKNSSSEPPAPVADTTAPTISLVDPVAGKSIALGALLHLQMDLVDNKELKSYKVVIAKSTKGVVTSDWAYSNTWTIAAGTKTFNVNHNEITVPLTVTGNPTTTGSYNMTITCLDASGNEATKTISITLTN